MISVSDAIKILDQVPIWKQIRELPKRIAALEQRVAELESGPKKPTGKECAMCGAQMRVTAEHPHRQFAFSGRKVHELECECGHKTERDFKPGLGYQ